MDKPYFQALMERVDEEYRHCTVYPPRKIYFGLFSKHRTNRRKSLFWDKTHITVGQAQGLSFSVSPGVTIPPSLRNIHKELASIWESRFPITVPCNRGRIRVLLLNAVLTVREGEPNSHKGIGWEKFTDTVITKLNERDQPMVLYFGKLRTEERFLHRPKPA